MPLRALQVLKFFFILTVADISCFARQFCFMIRSRKERHFVHHAMVQTLFILFINVSFFISLSLSLSLSLLSYLFLINPVPFCVFTQHSILHFFFLGGCDHFILQTMPLIVPMQFAKNLNLSAF